MFYGKKPHVDNGRDCLLQGARGEVPHIKGTQQGGGDGRGRDGHIPQVLHFVRGVPARYGFIQLRGAAYQRSGAGDCPIDLNDASPWQSPAFLNFPCNRSKPPAKAGGLSAYLLGGE